jgi:hypothetical protein
VPAFDYLLTDLGRIDDAALSADARLQAGQRRARGGTGVARTRGGRRLPDTA